MENKKEIRVIVTSEERTRNYTKVNQEINKWPAWKKEAYDTTFAVSTHAKKAYSR